MSMDFRRRLPIPAEVKEEMPLSARLAVSKAERDWEIAQVLKGASSKKLMIVGPCSAHDEAAVLEFCLRLAKLQEQVKDQLIIVPRVHTQRARKDGKGYKGMLHQPLASGPSDMLAGIRTVRQLNLRIIQETGLFAADEMLYPETYRFFSDLLVYSIIGNRSVEDQEHRMVASGLDIAVGMSTPTSGDFMLMLDGIDAAQNPHMFLYRNWEVATSGNPLTHALLQGYTDGFGRRLPNYDHANLVNLVGMYQEKGLKNPALVVDCSHGNAQGDFRNQPVVAQSVIESCRQDADVASVVKGFMVEAFLEEGSQPVGGDCFGQSVTDGCLGWEDTERLVLEVAGL